MLTYGERLKKIRKETGLTQEQFAKSIGVTRNPIASAEIGKSKLQPLAVHKICELYNINEEWFINGIGSMKNTYNIPEYEVKNLLKIYSRLPEVLRKDFIHFLENMVNNEDE